MERGHARATCRSTALAKRSKDGVRDAGGFPIEFVTIAVSDGISMGHEGMRASLVSREVIADSIETMMHAERFDALLTFAGCDKSLPGMLMAAARLNLPAVFLYGGSILPRARRCPGPCLDDQALDIVSVFEAVGAHAAGSLSDEELSLIEHHACPDGGVVRGDVHRQHHGVGGRGASACRCRARPRRRPSTPAARTSPTSPGEAVLELLARDIRPRDIMTKAAFENAIAVVMALGGSTNAVLHLLAIANEARVELSLDDFNRVAARVPHIADTKPHGRYHMVDVDRVGGVPVVMRELLDAGLLHGDCLTVTGRTMAENLAVARPARARRRRWSTRCRPRSTPTGASPCCGARWPPTGAWSRWRASTRPRFEGTARVFDGEQGALDAILAGQIEPGHRRRHPLRRAQGRPRHARDAGRDRRHEGGGPGRGLRARDRRAVLGRHPRVLRRPRRARSRGRRAHRLRGRRRPHRDRRRRQAHRPRSSTTPSWPAAAAQWKLPEPRYTTGVLAKYARLVTGAERGAVTEP